MLQRKAYIRNSVPKCCFFRYVQKKQHIGTELQQCRYIYTHYATAIRETIYEHYIKYVQLFRTLIVTQTYHTRNFSGIN